MAPPYCYKVNAKLLTLKCKVLCYSASNYLSSLTSCLNGDVAVYPAQASRGKREKKLMCRAPGTSRLHEKNLLLPLPVGSEVAGKQKVEGTDANVRNYWNSNPGHNNLEGGVFSLT